MFCNHFCTIKTANRNQVERFEAGGEKYCAKFNNHLFDLNLTLNWSHAANILVLVTTFVSSNPERLRTKSKFYSGKEAVITVPNAFSLPTSDYSSVAERECKCLIIIIPTEQIKCVSTTSKDCHKTKDEFQRKDILPIKEIKLLKLSSDIASLHQSGAFSDVILTNERIEIPCHKFLLAARSPVFNKMFKHSMKENRENRVTILDVSDAVLKEMLSFIYTGAVIIPNMEMASSLYVVSDKYDIQDLQAVCSDALKNVSLDNVLDVLSMASLYDDHVLKQSSMNFVAENFSRVKRHKSWKNFTEEYKDLCIELLTFVAGCLSEK